MDRDGIDLASRRLGGSVVAASDESFGVKAHLSRRRGRYFASVG